MRSLHSELSQRTERALCLGWSLLQGAPAAMVRPAPLVLSPEISWSGGLDGRLQACVEHLGPPAVDQRLYPAYVLKE